MKIEKKNNNPKIASFLEAVLNLNHTPFETVGPICELLKNFH